MGAAFLAEPDLRRERPTRDSNEDMAKRNHSDLHLTDVLASLHGRKEVTGSDRGKSTG